MRWRYSKFSSLERLIRELLRILRQLLVVFDGDVEESLEQLDRIAEEYRLWRDDFGPEDFRRLLREIGEAREGAGERLELTRKGERALRRQMLHEVFANLGKRGPGEHRTPHEGGPGDPTDETRPFRFGDGLDALDASRTLHNWVARTGGAGHPEEPDLEVREREFQTSAATVLLIDISHSMTLYGEDRITPAKRVALALAELIRTKYPKDSLDVVLFGDEAHVVPLEKLPYITNGPYHTNTRAGLVAAQEILKRRKGANRQIILITDGKPSAIHEEGRIYKNPMGLDPWVLGETFREVAACRRAGILINTFMLARDADLVAFVHKVTAMCRGKAYFTTPQTLGRYLLMDYVSRKVRTIH